MKQPTNEQYNQYVEHVTPKNSCLLNCVKAFVVGGAICVLGQILFALFQNVGGMEEKDASGYVTVCRAEPVRPDRAVRRRRLSGPDHRIRQFRRVARH